MPIYIVGIACFIKRFNRMTSNFITNLLRGPAYTKEYKEQLEAKLLKEFTENVEDKNIFANADTFVDYCKNTYNPEGKDVAVDDFWILTLKVKTQNI